MTHVLVFVGLLAIAIIYAVVQTYRSHRRFMRDRQALGMLAELLNPETMQRIADAFNAMADEMSTKFIPQVRQAGEALRNFQARHEAISTRSGEPVYIPKSRRRTRWRS